MEISPFLHSLIHAEFHTTHFHDEYFEKSYFCVDCGGNSLSKSEKKTEHKGHKVFKAKKNSNHYSYKRDDILSLGSEIIDISGVRIYFINDTHVVFPKSRIEKRHHKIGKPGYCFACGMRLSKAALFCSILCKLECKEELKRLVEDSLNKKVKKRKRDDKNGGKQNVVCIKIKHGCKTVILGNKVEEVKTNTEKLDYLTDVMDGQIVDDGKKITYRKKSRKGIPQKAPLF